MHVLVYEPIFWGGHNLMYVRQLVRTLADLSVEVTLVTGVDAEQSEQFKQQIAPWRSLYGRVAATTPAAKSGEDWGRHYFEDERKLLGDIWPIGVKANYTNLERFIEYSHDQNLLGSCISVESLFPTEMLDT